MGPKTPLEKTSIQLSADTLRDMNAWPGLTRSEAIRLSVERAHYFSALDSEQIAGLAHRFAPILAPALRELEYKDYRLAARALPAIVEGFLSEKSNASFRDLDGRSELDPQELLQALHKLDPIGRMGILDCTVAERHTGETKRGRGRERRG